METISKVQSATHESKLHETGLLQAFVAVVDRISEYISGVLQALMIMALTLMVIVEVITRYIMNSPLSIADEIGGYMLVSITFMGLAYTLKEDGHVRVELVVNCLGEPLKSYLRLVTFTIGTLFCIPMIIGSYQLLQDSILFVSRSGSWMRIPLVYPQSVLLGGSVLLLFQFLAESIKLLLRIRSGRKERDHGF